MANRHSQRDGGQGGYRGGQERGGSRTGGGPSGSNWSNPRWQDLDEGRTQFGERQRSGGYGEGEFGQQGRGRGDWSNDAEANEEGMQGRYGRGGMQGGGGSAYDPVGAGGMGESQGFHGGRFEGTRGGWGNEEGRQQSYEGTTGGAWGGASGGGFRGGGSSGGYGNWGTSPGSPGAGQGSAAGSNYGGTYAGSYGSGARERGGMYAGSEHRYDSGLGSVHGGHPRGASFDSGHAASQGYGQQGGYGGSQGGPGQQGYGQQGYGHQGARGAGRFAGKRGPKGWQRSDDRIKEDLCEQLYNSDDIDSSDVSVEVSQGKVALEGTVRDRYTKHAIEDLVDGCPGVKDIDNRIRVSRENEEPGAQSQASGREGSSSQAFGSGSSSESGQSSAGSTSGYGSGSASSASGTTSRTGRKE